MIIITGASGNIGRKISADLLLREQKIKCIARNIGKLKALSGKGAEIAAGSLDDAAFLTEPFICADAVFAMIPPNYTALDFRTYQNIVGASIAKAIGNSGIKYIVNLSSKGASVRYLSRDCTIRRKGGITSAESTSCICDRHTLWKTFCQISR